MYEPKSSGSLGWLAAACSAAAAAVLIEGALCAGRRCWLIMCLDSQLHLCKVDVGSGTVVCQRQKSSCMQENQHGRCRQLPGTKKLEGVCGSRKMQESGRSSRLPICHRHLKSIWDIHGLAVHTFVLPAIDPGTVSVCHPLFSVVSGFLSKL